MLEAQAQHHNLACAPFGVICFSIADTSGIWWLRFWPTSAEVEALDYSLVKLGATVMALLQTH
jgi:hypothetical protein